MPPVPSRDVTLLQVDVPGFLEQTVSNIIAFLPRLVAAVVILLIGWVVGRAAAALIRRLVDGVELDRAVLDTPLGDMLGGTERAVSQAFGVLGKWFVYALAILAAADVLAIALLSEWLDRAVTYLPAFVAGLAIIVVGFVVADFVGDAIKRTRAATETAYTNWVATAVQLFLYFTVLVIGLDTMGVDVGILFVFARALAWGIAAAIALGAGIALGWGSKDYVAENIDRWSGRASSSVPEPGEPASRRETGGPTAPPEGSDEPTSMPDDTGSNEPGDTGSTGPSDTGSTGPSDTGSSEPGEPDRPTEED